jgi:RNA polymerase sigma factor (sigma-70 family)
MPLKAIPSEYNGRLRTVGSKAMALSEKNRQFETLVMPHLDAAYNLARWLLRDEHSASDAVQDACLRALRFFDHLKGEDARPWLLAIVRNCCYSMLGKRQRSGESMEFDEERDSEFADSAISDNHNPETTLSRKMDSARLDEAIARLPSVYREVIVLREMEELAYEEVAQIANIPLGTVMSRLSRARALLRARLAGVDRKDRDE